MVKKKAGAAKTRDRAERRLKASGPESTSGGGGSTDGEGSGSGRALPAHLQKKVARKIRFLNKVAESRTAILGTRNPTIKKKKRRKNRGDVGVLGDLGALAASLAEAASEDAAKGPKRRKGLGVGGTRKRLNIIQKETERLQTVFQNPVYKKNPLAAIAGHLNATLPPPPEVPEVKPVLTAEQRKAERKRKAAARTFLQQLDADMVE